MQIFYRTLIVILLFILQGGYCTSEKNNDGNKYFDELNDKLSLSNFNFLELDMKRSEIISKVGKPTGWGKGGHISVYYKLKDGSQFHLVFNNGLNQAYITKDNKLIKFYLVKEIVYSQNIKKRFKLKNFQILKQGMSYMSIYDHFGFPNKRTGGKDARLLYYLTDGRTLSLKIDNGLAEAQILDKNGKFIKEFLKKKK